MAGHESNNLKVIEKQNFNVDIEHSWTLQSNSEHAPTLKKDFSPLQIASLGFNVCNSWVAIATSFAIIVAAGGTVTLVYGVIVASVVYGLAAIALAELASVYPTAGGQYHFASLVAPKSISRVASYSCGAIAVFSWIALCTAATIIAAQVLLALPAFFVETYTPEAWHYFLVYQTINVFILLYNVVALKRTLWVHDVGFALTLVTFLVTVVTCLAMSTKQSSSYVWTNFVNNTGWSDGVCFLTGLVTPCFMFAGLDAVLHLAEECSNPRKTVPQALMSTVSIGFLTGFVFSIAMCYSLLNLDDLLNTTMPIYELWRQATSNTATATTFIVALLCVLFFTINAMQQTASHMIWAFARDDALIFSKQLSRIQPKLGVPVWGLLANAACVFITGCLYLASTAAFNALINSTIVLQMTSYAIPCLMLLLQRRSEVVLPKSRSFRVPDWLGWLSNLTVIIFAVVELVFFSFPTALPVTGSSMNYTCAVLGIMGLFTAVNWFLHARKHYMGPIINMQ